MKLCKNCKYYKKGNYDNWCYHPVTHEQGVVSVITGLPYFIKRAKKCAVMRYYPDKDSALCGESGKLYEPTRFRKILITLRIVDE